MPTCLAASTTSVPRGTRTVLPSIVSETRLSDTIFLEERIDRLAGRRRALAVLGVVLPLVAPLADRAGDAARRRVAERAERHLVRRPEPDPIGDPEQRVDVLGVALALADAAAKLDHPAGALPAGGALAA